MAAAQSFHGLNETVPTHLQNISQCRLDASWATIGIYDGVHRGHQAILEQLVTGAHARRLPTVVVTFHPHPSVVLGQETGFKLLTLPDERARLLHARGVDCVLTLPFTEELANTSAADFMRMLKAHIGLQHLFIGYDFALGRHREGDAARLRELGLTLGYTLTHVQAVGTEAQVYSSSAIRAALRQGDIQTANHMLGRAYTICGQVVHGDGRGRQIDIPTANIQAAPEKLVPAAGVYAGFVRLGGEKYPAVTNIGVRPTFGQPSEARIEAHLLDFSGDLYGETLCFEVLARLRDEQKFTSVDALVAQIQQDIHAARQILPKTLTKYQRHL